MYWQLLSDDAIRDFRKKYPWANQGSTCNGGGIDFLIYRAVACFGYGNTPTNEQWRAFCSIERTLWGHPHYKDCNHELEAEYEAKLKDRELLRTVMEYYPPRK